MSECITTHSLTDIPLGSLAPQPSALTWATTPRRPSEPGSRQPGQGWEQCQGQGQQHTGSLVARGCWLCPPPQNLPLSHGQCSCPHHTLSGGARCCRAPVPADGTDATWGKPSPLHSRRLPGGAKGCKWRREGRSALVRGWRDGGRDGDCGSASDTALCLCWHMALHSCYGTQAAPCPTGPKLCPAPSHAKPSCSCCAGTTQSQEAAAGPEGWCRVPWALWPGPLS